MHTKTIMRALPKRKFFENDDRIAPSCKRIALLFGRSLGFPLVGLFALAACKTSPESPDAGGDLAWAYRPEARTEAVPFPELTPAASISAGSDRALRSEAWPWGNPQDLTQLLSEHGRGAALPTPAPVKEGRGEGRDRDAGSVVVNFNTGGSVGQPEVARPVVVSALATSRLEGLYLGKFEKKASRELVQFGYAFFDRGAVALESQGPVPNHYRIGPGDELVVTLSGSIDAIYPLVVDREGRVNLPDFGSLSIAGERFGDLSARLRSFLAERRQGFELSVSLGRIRPIQVKVAGRVSQPGVVEVPALGTPLTALLAAGGPAKDGTLRRIRIQRTGPDGPKTIEVDLYGLLRGLSPELEAPLLEDGDVVIVPPIGPTVGIAGFVQQPAIYETLDEAITVGEALTLAGGLTPFSFTPLAHLERTVDGRGRQRVDVELSPEGLAQTMSDGELLMVEAVDDDRQPVVRIEGEIARPGDYEHRVGMTLSDLVRRADGLTIDAYLPQVFISRQLGPSEALENVPARHSHRQSRRVIVADLGAALRGEAEHDIALMPLDLVTVRSQSQARIRATVEILGSVQRPGKYELTAGMRVSDLIAIAGNPTPDVYFDEAELIRRVFDESARRLDVKRFRFDLRGALNPVYARDDQLNPVLSNGDRLVVRALQQAQVRGKIGGRVRFPGEYVFPAGATITDLIAAAGGILPDADLRAAHFSRESTRALQQQRLSHLSERTRRLSEDAFTRIVQSGRANEGLAGRLALEQGQDALQRMLSAEADGRIVIPFSTPGFPQSRYNLTLENGDALQIPRFHSTVSIAGHVFRPLTLVADETLTVEMALEQAGGLTESADEDLLYVVRADGRVDSVAQKPARLSRKTPLLPGDVLLVPSKPIERTLGAQLGDALILARQMAEVALLASQVGNPIDATFVSPFVPDHSNTDPSILRD